MGSVETLQEDSPFRSSVKTIIAYLSLFGNRLHKPQETYLRGLLVVPKAALLMLGVIPWHLVTESLG